MSSVEVPAIPQPAYKNRRGLLIACGIVQMLIGACLLMMTAIVLLVPLAQVAETQPQPISKSLLVAMGLVIYGVPAIVFVTLGIGSVMAKNWARVGTLIVSWIWLAFGVFQMFLVIFLMPSIIRAMPPQPNQPANMEQIIVVGAAIFFGAFFVVLPSIFLIAYHSKHVRATCLAGAKAATGVQVPVILWVLTIWMGLGVLSMIYILFTRYPAVIFGVLISGVMGKLVYLLTGVVYAWATWGLWRRDMLAWRTTFWLQVFWVASAIVTFTTRDVLQLYRDMGMSAQELAFFERLPMPPSYFVLLCLLPTLVFVVLLFYAKRYFNQPAGTPAAV